jgi:hypothetical protein
MSNSTEAPYFNVKVGTMNSNTNGKKTDGTDTVYCYVTTETVPLSVNSANYSQIYPSSTSNLVCSYNNTSITDPTLANVNCIPQNATAPAVTDTSLAYCITPTLTTSGSNKSISCKYTTTAAPASNTFNC